MGLNFYAGCHRCKTKQFFFRGDEAKPMHQFWRKHADCIRADKNACVIQGDGYGEQDWMTDYADDEPEADTANSPRQGCEAYPARGCSPSGSWGAE